MKFIRYSKFKGFDVSGVNLGDLMEALQDSLLQSGFDDDYYWTRQQRPQDTSLDALREALLRALLETGEVDEQQVREMLAENEGKFKGSQLEELLNQLIERLVEEGLLNLHEEPPQEQQQGHRRGQGGTGRVDAPAPPQRNVKFEVTEKGLDFLGYKTLRNLLGSMGKSSVGRHDTPHLATGVEAAQASKLYEFGDTINLDVNATLMSAIRREGLGVPLNLEYSDLYVHQCDYQSSCATVVMLDCSHSMILYGEDRFTPAKKVALALAHLIRTQYAGDSLKVVLFHDDAEELPLAKLATTQVGPYHTNTAEGLKLARRLLQAQRKEMKQIVMVTDGKPTACFLDGAGAMMAAGSRGGTRRRTEAASGAGVPDASAARRLYKNSMGLDPVVMDATFNEVQACRKAGIMINTFMLASDYYLVEFVKQMSQMTNGKAYFATPGNLTQFVLIDFLKRKKSTVR
ncbi:MAG TPA: VWA domain-containing protein [Pyrinomonadaceae bacterium]|jgi:Ca-activated chloride channel family protein|nr:VWA domain-containing protein [Pyrinomonadaceae bacterium]